MYMKVFSLFFGGDTSLGDWYLRRAGKKLSGRLDSDPMSFFRGVRAVADRADALVLNFESVLSKDPVSHLAGKKKYLGWDSPERTLQALSELNVTAVSLANNHTMDFGPSELLSTIGQLRKSGIACFGAGETADIAREPLKLEINIEGVVRNCYVLSGLKDTSVLRNDYKFFASENTPGVNPISADSDEGIIKYIRERDPESLIIYYPHWGQNYKWSTRQMRMVARRMLKAGADLVLGHGAHMMQELILEPEGSGTYSLGNFVFNSIGRYESLGAPGYSLVTRVDLAVVEGEWAARMTHYPILSDNLKSDFRPRFLDEREASEVYEMLLRKHPDEEGFRNSFCLKYDQFAWGIQQKTPISPKYRLLEDKVEAVAGKVGISPERYGEGSSFQCFIQALDERAVPYEKLDAKIRGSVRPAVTFNAAGQKYLISAARIYSVSDDGKLTRVDRVAGRIVKNKAHVNSMLRGAGYSAPEGSVFDKDQIREALYYFDALANVYEYGFCVKPVDGGLGRHVYVGVVDRSRYLDALRQVFSDYKYALVEKHWPGGVYRFLWVAGRVSAVRYGMPMNVVGDGFSSVRTLVDRKNDLRRMNRIHKYYLTALGADENNFLKDQGMGPDSVVESGRRVLLSGKSNLHAGADIIDCTDEVHSSYLDSVSAAASIIPGAFVLGVDVAISKPDSKASSENHAIIEFNTGPGIGSHHHPLFGSPRDVAGDIISAILSGAALQS